MSFISGNLPELIFAAFIPSQNLNGDLTKSSSLFGLNGISEVNICLNGSACQGYPLKILDDYPIWPYQKFLETTKRSYNPMHSNIMDMTEFNQICLFCKKILVKKYNIVN